MVEITWIYVDAKRVPGAKLRRRLNSNGWVALCDLYMKEGETGSIQPDKAVYAFDDQFFLR